MAGNELANPRSVLVINVSRIGDTLLVTPALRALARHWPRARLTFLGHPNRSEVIRHVPGVAELGSITKRRALSLGWLGGGRYDLALVYNFDRPLVSYALRVARKVVAFEQGSESIDSRLYRCVPKASFRDRHSVEVALMLTRALGVPDAGMRLSYTVTAAEQAWARAELRRRLPNRSGPMIGLQVATFHTKSYRDWPLESFAELCQRIIGRWPGASFVIIGGADERPRTDQLVQRLAGRAISVAGELTLRESGALLNEADLYIGLDSGPTHIVGALERPMVALYHCYSPSRLIRPLERDRCHVVDHPRTIEECTRETSMAEIPVDAVWRKVLEAMGGR